MSDPQDFSLWEMATQDKAALDELRGSSDRSMAIIGGAILDASLHDAIAKAAVNDADQFNRLFGPNGQVPAFEAKARVGYLFGLFSKEIHRDLVRISKVRNYFAHHSKGAVFSNQPVREFCRDLTCVERFVFDDMTPSGVPAKSDWSEMSVRSSMLRLHLTDRDVRMAQPRERYYAAILVLHAALEFPRTRPNPPTF